MSLFFIVHGWIPSGWTSYKLIVIVSSLHSISVHNRFHRNALLLDSRGNLNQKLGGLRIYLFIFREREREGEREGEKCQCVFAFLTPPPGTWPATQAYAQTGNQTHDPLVHRLVLNPLSHTSQNKKKTRWFKQQTLIFSQVCRLGV